MTIGDELLIGQVVDTNASWIAEQVTALGANVTMHSTVPDDRDYIMSELSRLERISDLVILTGGLGPTHDDITKDVLGEYFEDKLVLNKEALEHIEEMFRLRGREVTERNRAQAFLPSTCKYLQNKVGTAPGMFFDQGSKYIVSLPGVPQEMKFIVENSLLPIVKQLVLKKDKGVKLYRTIKTAGIFESSLADLIGEPGKFIGDGSLAFLPSGSGVRLRVGVIGKNFEEAGKKLDAVVEYVTERVQKYVVGFDNESLATHIGKTLLKAGKTVAVAESCTAGLLGGALTEISGSSKYFLGGYITYSNESKIELLGVSKETIDVFGAVSSECSIEMAEKIRRKFNSDFGISITGIAGPDGGSPSKPVGTVWIGVADNENTVSHKFIFGNDRQLNRERAVAQALNLLLEKLTGQ